jgi:hypothetical protein
MDSVSWGYDFVCGKSIEVILGVFNSEGSWQWTIGDSDIYGDYLKCRPKEQAEIRVYDARQFWTWSAGDREGFWAELTCDGEDRAPIDQKFLGLLRGIDARNISDS